MRRSNVKMNINITFPKYSNLSNNRNTFRSTITSIKRYHTARSNVFTQFKMVNRGKSTWTVELINMSTELDEFIYWTNWYIRLYRSANVCNRASQKLSPLNYYLLLLIDSSCFAEIFHKFYSRNFTKVKEIKEKSLK